jgi:hypothetical protein
MTITVDWLTKTFFVPQSDLTFVSGTLYEMDTEAYFRAGVNAIMASEEGIPFDTPIDHNAEYTVAGVTYARKIEMINGYNLTFTPDAQWSVRLAGSNNNLFDIENGILNQNQVQVIPQNSAGLITSPRIDELWRLQGLDKDDPMTMDRIAGSRKTQSGDIDLVITGTDDVRTVTRQP